MRFRTAHSTGATMKQARQVIARWVAKFTAPAKTPVATTATTDLRPIDVEQLRQVAGGAGQTPQSPKGNW
jgi:hypothetical protein